MLNRGLNPEIYTGIIALSRCLCVAFSSSRDIGNMPSYDGGEVVSVTPLQRWQLGIGNRSVAASDAGIFTASGGRKNNDRGSGETLHELAPRSLFKLGSPASSTPELR